MNEEQTERIEALQAASPLVRKTGGPFGPSTPGDMYDLVDLAEYILYRVHPYNRPSS